VPDEGKHAGALPAAADAAAAKKQGLQISSNSYN